MVKILCFLFTMAFIAACGQKSEIKPLFKPVKLSESHGDGKNAIFTIKLPISEQTIDPISSDVDPSSIKIAVLGDFTKLFQKGIYNLATSTFGMGKALIIVEQPIPDLKSPYLAGFSIKRVFFKIAEDEKKVEIPNNFHRRRHAREIIRNLWQGIREIMRGGDGDLSLDFLSDVQMKVKAVKINHTIDSYVPTNNVIYPLKAEDEDAFLKMKDDKSVATLIDYNKETHHDNGSDEKVQRVVFVDTENPVKVKNFFLKNPEIGDSIDEVSIINKTLFIQVKEEEGSLERFVTALQALEDELSDLKIKKFDMCSPKTCIDFDVNQKDMLPILTSGNQINIETFVNAKKVPAKSFVLKGFVEFEIKLNAPL